jgi:hypothetical protein
MTQLPLWLRCLFVAVLVATMALAFWGRPPRRRPRPATWRSLAGLGVVFYGGGCAALLVDEAAISAALVGAGVETLSVVAWLGRGLSGEDDGGGGGGGGGEDPGSGGEDGDGSRPDGQWGPTDERDFWDYVSRGGRSRDPIAG